MIEAATSGTGAGNEHAIENDPSRFVGIEPRSQEAAKVTCALGVSITKNAWRNRTREADAALNGRRHCSVFEVGGKVAKGRKAEARNGRIAGRVDRFIQVICQE